MEHYSKVIRMDKVRKIIDYDVKERGGGTTLLGQVPKFGSFLSPPEVVFSFNSLTLQMNID